MFSGSWQPKLAAIIAFLAALFNSLSAMLDSDPTTNPQWTMVASLGALAIGLFRTRQDSVTSEQVGAVTKPDSVLVPTSPPPIVRATGEPVRPVPAGPPPA